MRTDGMSIRYGGGPFSDAGFVMYPSALLELQALKKISAIEVNFMLWAFYFQHPGGTLPRLRGIAQVMGCTKSCVSKIITSLVSKGIIQKKEMVTPRGNVYLELDFKPVIRLVNGVLNTKHKRMAKPGKEREQLTFADKLDIECDWTNAVKLCKKSLRGKNCTFPGFPFCIACDKILGETEEVDSQAKIDGN